MKVRVAIPAANPPDNATDLTSPTYCRASHLRTSKNPMSECKGLARRQLGASGVHWTILQRHSGMAGAKSRFRLTTISMLCTCTGVRCLTSRDNWREQQALHRAEPMARIPSRRAKWTGYQLSVATCSVGYQPGF